MATQPAVPPRETLEAQARRLLEEARGRAGASVEDMVKSLGELQPRGAETRRSWYDWNEKPETISLLTGLAAIHMLGPEGTIELLFGDRTTADLGEPSAATASRIDDLQAALADAVTDIARLHERVENFVVPELAKQGELMSRLLSETQRADMVADSDTQERPPKRGGAVGS